jgi:hypothetical protein
MRHSLPSRNQKSTRESKKLMILSVVDIVEVGDVVRTSLSR